MYNILSALQYHFCVAYIQEFRTIFFCTLHELISSFYHRYNMTTHLKAHQGIHRSRPKPHYCSQCGETFNRIEKLRDHLSTVHSDVPDTIKDDSTESSSMAEVKYDSIIVQPVFC